MRLKIYASILTTTVILFSLFNQAFAQISPKTIREIKLLLQEKESRSPAQKKMDSRLLQAAREKRGQKMTAGVDLQPANVNPERDGRVKVDIHAEVTDELINKIVAGGGTIIYPSKEYHTVRAVINLASAETIAGYNEVKFIEPAVLSQTQGSGDPNHSAKKQVTMPSVTIPVKVIKRSVRPRPSMAERRQRIEDAVKKYLQERQETNQLVLNAGIANSEGDHSHRADDARNRFGYAGQGIKIGVLSDSYNALGGAPADVLSDDLPGTGNPFGNTTPVTVVADYAGGEDEGRAMLQIIHDLAPKAQLFFATADISEASFANNIVALRTTYNCDIIIDDVAYFDEPAFQDGIVAQAVNTVTAAGALYFSSAGNSGSVALGTAGVWEGDFNDAGSPAFTGGSKIGTIHNFGSTPANGDSILAIASGAYNLQWSDPWGASANDYDLFLVSSAGTVKASSTTVQSGTQNPYEAFAPPTLAAGDRLIVFKAASAAVRAISLNSNRGRLKVATTGQTHGHAAAADAYGVAAIPATNVPFVNTNTVETFTSDGLRRIFYNADGTAVTAGNVLFSTNGGTVRNKPDITAADGVSTTLPSSTGLNPFFGTSAAAPHAGAIAALIKSASPSMTSAQIRSLLTSTALDIQSPGYDNVSGYGVLQAYQAMVQVNPAPLPYINLGTTTFSEGSYSNANGSIDPGETGKLVVQLNNSSLVNAAGVTATVTSATSGVTITQGSSNYNTINSGTNASNTGTPFMFAVNKSVACGTVITFQIKITFSGGVGTVGYIVTTKVGQLITPGNISSTLGSTPPTGSGYTVTTGQQTGRLVRGTAASTCAVPVANPGLTATTGSRQYDAYTFTNTTGASQCYTVTLTSSNGLNIYTVAYNSSGFVPSNPSTNYLAEPGQSANTQTYSFTVAAGAAFTVVVHDVNVTPASNSPYNLSVTYIGCGAAPACTPVTITTSSIAGGATGSAYTQSFSATGGSGSYAFSVSGDLPAGLSFSGNTLSGTPTQAGSFPITVTATDLTGCPGDSKNYTLVIAGVAPASVTSTAGTPQTVLPGATFPVALQVTVKDAGNNPLSGVNVKFTAPPQSSASGTFAGGDTIVTIVTNSSGIATAPTFTANSKTGSYTVTAAVTGVATPANFSLNNTCPASFVVTSNADSGPGTLRDIINNACVASTVTFDPSVTNITLTSGELAITKAITITGPGATLLTISGNNSSRIFNISTGSAATSFSGMTLKNASVPSTSANGGGAFLINNGSGAGIVNITSCVLTNNNVTLPGNALGGGVDNEGGTVTIDRSSITNNTTSYRGAAIQNQGFGSMIITNSTIAGNTAGTGGIGGGIRSFLPLTITNCTFFGNSALSGGNISVGGGTTTIGNSIIAGGSLTGAGTGPDISGAVVSANFDLIQNTSGATITGSTTHNITGTSPNLFPLGYYGGSTPTLLPMLASPVINAGDTTLISGTDQRGFSRLVGSQADIGSTEATATYFSKSSGSLEQVGTWGTNADGTGTPPSDFISDNQLFNIRNNATPVVGDNWTVSGNNSAVLAGDATNALSLSVAASKNFTVNNSATFQVQNNASVVFNPASAFTIGTGTQAYFNNMPVTFTSNATGTARLAQVLGTINNAPNVTVQRYIPSRRAWRLMTAPLSNTNTIYQAWQNGGINTPGIGTFITSPTGQNGLDAGINYSLKTFDVNSQLLVPVDSTNVALSASAGPAANKGYFIFVRGDRTLANLTPPNTNITTLNSKGTLQTGTQTFIASGTEDQFTLVGNPYVSPVDFSLLTRTNLIKRFYAWDPALNTVGGYVTVDDFTNTGIYSVTPPSTQTSILQSSQAFFVQTATTAPASITFNETSKSTVITNAGFRTNNGTSEVLRTTLYLKNKDTSILADGVLAEYNNNFSKDVTAEDAPKFANINENLAILRAGQSLSIERRPLVDGNDTMFLNLTNTTSRSYTFTFEPTNISSVVAAWLEDAYLKTSTPVSLNTANSV